MARNAMAVLAVALFFVIILVVLVGGGGLDSGLKNRVEVQLAKFETAEPAARQNLAEARSALEDEPRLLNIFAETWPPRIERAESDLDAADTAAQELRTLVSQNDPDTESRVVELETRLSSSLAAGSGVAAELARNGRELIEFRDKIADEIRAMEQNLRTIESTSLAPVEAAVRAAQVDWPAKSNDLTARLRAMTGAKAAAARLWAETEQARAEADAGNVDADAVRELAAAAEAMRRTKLDLEGSDRLLGLIDELYWSWDKVLVDMELAEGAVVTFRHKFRTTYIPADLDDNGVSPSGRQTRTADTTETVSKSEYDRMKNNLGMVVMHKPAGMFDHEAQSMVQPAGYAYIAEPGERNRYGYWNGGFWVWYGQYALMRDLFWGPSYTRIGRDDYSSYSRHRASGRTYYGEGGNRYGSRGNATRTKYGSSQYVKTNGYANSRYERSGGTYRGSRYASRSTSRSGGFSRSGSRSGGK